MLPRYLLRQALAPTLLALGLLAALVFGLQALRLGHHLVGSGEGIALVALVFACSLPTLLVFGLPLAIAAGVLLTTSRLASELEGMRCLGASPARLASNLIALTLAGAIATFLLATRAEPQSLTLLHRLLRDGASHALVAQLRPGVFSRIGKSTIYLRDRDPIRDGEPLRGRGFFLAHGDDLLVAERAELRVLPGPRLALRLHDGELQRRGEGVLDRIHFRVLEKKIDLAPIVARHFAFLGRRATHARGQALSHVARLVALDLLVITLALVGDGRRRWILLGVLSILLHEGVTAPLAPTSAARLALEATWIFGAIALLGLASRGHHAAGLADPPEPAS